MNYCTKCGAPVKSEAKFCTKCGAVLQGGGNGSRPAAAAVTEQPRKKRKKGRMIIPAVCIVFVLAVILLAGKGEGAGTKCETCEEIAQLQAQLQAKMNEDAGSVSNPYLRRSQIEALGDEILILCNHDCKAPVKTVKNKEFIYGTYEGTYSGEWRSVMPYGEGKFCGSYVDNGAQYVLSYSGTWSAGMPNGTGAMIRHRQNLYETYGENWFTEMYEGAFVNGKLNGEGFSCTDSSAGGRFEYYNGTYKNGLLNGAADFIEYRDGELYDMGKVEGQLYAVTYSRRQEFIQKIDTVKAVVLGVGATIGFVALVETAAKASFGELDPNSPAVKSMQQYIDSVHADEERWRQNKIKEAKQKEDEKKANEEEADYWEREYERWKEIDPKNYHTTDAERNMNYYRSKANGTW